MSAVQRGGGGGGEGFYEVTNKDFDTVKRKK